MRAIARAAANWSIRPYLRHSRCQASKKLRTAFVFRNRITPLLKKGCSGLQTNSVSARFSPLHRALESLRAAATSRCKSGAIMNSVFSSSFQSSAKGAPATMSVSRKSVFSNGLTFGSVVLYSREAKPLFEPPRMASMVPS